MIVDTTFYVLSLIKVFGAAAALIIVLPLLTWHNYLKGKPYGYRFVFCVVVQNCFLINLVLLLGFLNICNRLTVTLGIAALVLAKNTNLTAAEVRSILRKSCAKIGGVTYSGGEAGAGGWNNYYGYGKLMATLALNNTPSPGGPVFSGIAATGGATVTMPFLSPSGVQCLLQYTTNLGARPVVWVPANSKAGTGGEITLQDNTPTDPARMYRVIRGP